MIIPAAGSGSRLKRDIPKPFIKLAGKPILQHTVEKFLNQQALARIIVATSSNYMHEARLVLQEAVTGSAGTYVIEGGRERQGSILNALDVIGDVDLVMIHDAVRPFVTPKQIATCCKAAERADGAIMGVPAKDTIKSLDENGYVMETPDRKYLWQAQTPQVFKKEVLVEAYRKALEDEFMGTDDASLVERLGYSVRMIEGSYANFKITYPVDLQIASILLSKEKKNE